MRVPTIAILHNWRKRVSPNGRYRVCNRIYLSGQPARYYPIKFMQKIRKDKWPGKPQAWVKDNHPISQEANLKIAETLGTINELIRRFYLKGKSITFYVIERELMRKGERDIFNDNFQHKSLLLLRNMRRSNTPCL